LKTPYSEGNLSVIVRLVKDFCMRIFPGLVAAVAVALFVAGPTNAKTFKSAFPRQLEAVSEDYRVGLEALDIKQGTVSLEGGQVTLDVPDDYYYLDAKDARYVLETLWGNPVSTDTLGMLFPRDKSPIDDSWGIEITFDPMGYVSDEDAVSMDFDALLAEMKQDSVAMNAERVKAGYQAVELKGWATPPHYDPVERKLYWAKTLHFDGDEGDTLNYNIRALGRKGVLVVNFIARSDQLAEVERAAPAVLKMISFTEGNRYADYQPGVDTLAAVGIGGLIAGKVLAGKAGFLVLLLAFAKKGAFLLLVPVIWLKNKLFGKRPSA
jgi:uncharacterized membrane-anchored protein